MEAGSSSVQSCEFKERVFVSRHSIFKSGPPLTQLSVSHRSWSTTGACGLTTSAWLPADVYLSASFGSAPPRFFLSSGGRRKWLFGTDTLTWDWVGTTLISTSVSFDHEVVSWGGGWYLEELGAGDYFVFEQ